MTHQLSDRAQHIADSIARWPHQRVPLADLWRMLDDADPTTRTLIHRRQMLAEALQELADAQVVTLPSTRSFDHSEHPALPRFITGNARRDRSTRQRTSTIWHPSLAWAARHRLTPHQHHTLERINTWLFQVRDAETVPLRERSIEILDDEKALDRLILSGLFAPDKLSLNLLHARRVAPPLHTVNVGSGEYLLVVENSDTFDSISRATLVEPGNVGFVGWGAGAAFEASVLSTGSLTTVSKILYFGDLDARGLQIPINAGRVAASAGLPQVEPAVGLYASLMSTGKPALAKTAVSGETARTLVEWLPAPQRRWAEHLLTSRQRVAQEWVGTTHLRQTADWRSGLD